MTNQAETTTQESAPLKATELLTPSFPVVGIVGAAGSRQASKLLFRNLPADSGMAFVLVTRMASRYIQQLPALIQKQTDMPVLMATDTQLLQADHVYIAPAAHGIWVEGNRLRVQPLRQEANQQPLPGILDAFLTSLAKGAKQDAVAILLSGTGTDGVVGLAHVQAAGGLVMIQDPDEAAHAALPKRAVVACPSALVATAGEIVRQLVQLKGDLAEQLSSLPADANQDFDQFYTAILQQIARHTGHDLSHYKASTLRRRVASRMGRLGIAHLERYVEVLKSGTDEAHTLFQTSLVSVTSFFRDPDAYEMLGQDCIPQLFAEKKRNDTVRVWVAGCATGQEAYSVAMHLVEYAAQVGEPPRLQVFATDLDEEAIAIARRGIYPKAIAEQMSDERLGRFFTVHEEGYQVKSEIREHVLFAVHDLLADPPFSRLDLVTCRNVLIYFNRTAQAKLLEIFHYALNPEPSTLRPSTKPSRNYLFLGTSESIDAAPELFAVLDKQCHLYLRREVVLESQRRLPTVVLPALVDRPTERVRSPKATPPRTLEELYTSWLLRVHLPPRLLVNSNYEITHLFGNVSPFLQEPEGAVTQNVLQRIRAELLLDLRSALYQAFNKREHSLSRLLHLEINGTSHLLRLHVEQISEPGFPDGYAEVLFLSEKESEELKLLLSESIETDMVLVRRMEEELIRTRERMHELIEEYELSEQELKTANQELQSINEEVTSTTEELETSTEELQSMNEELVAVNNELLEKIEELNRSNSDLNNLIASTDVGTIFLDQGLRIKRFTPRATELVNLIDSDRGRLFSHITHRIRHVGLPALAARVLELGTRIEETVQRDDDCWYILRMFPYRTVAGEQEGVVITFVDINDLKRAESEERQRRQQQVLAQLGRQALEDGDLDRLLTSAVQQLVAVLDMEFCKVLELQPDGETFLLRAGVGWHEGLVGVATVPNGNHSQAGYTLQSTRPVIVRDLTTETRFQASTLLLDHGVRSGIGVTLYDTNGPYGVLSVHSRQLSNFATYDVDFLQSVANTLAAAIVRQRAVTQLRASEATARRYVEMIEASNDAIIVWSEEHGIEFWNQGAEKLYGFSAAEAIGRRSHELLSTIHSPPYAEILQKLEQGDGWEGELVHTTKAGERVTVSSRHQLIQGAQDAPVILEINRDISERKQHEADLQLLTALSELLQQADSADGLIAGVVHLLGEHLQVGRCLWIETDPQQGRGLIRAQHCRGLPPVATAYQHTEYSATTRAELLAGRLVVNADAKTDPRTAERYERVYAPQNERAYIGAPLLQEGKWHGILSITSPTPRQWQAREVNLMRTVSERVALALEQLRLNEALRISEARLQLATEVAGLAIGEADYLADIFHLTPEAARLFGLANEATSVPVTTVRALFHPDDQAEIHERLRRALDPSGNGEFTMEHRIVRPDGQVRWLSVRRRIFFSYPPDAPAHPMSGLLVTVDITERKQAEEALRASEAQLDAILQNIPAAVYMLTPDHRYLFVNRYFEQENRITNAEIRGLSVYDRFSPEVAASLAANEKEVLTKKVPMEWEESAPRGSELRYYATVKAPLLNDAGEPYAILGVSIDVTERKRAEVALRASQQQLETILRNVPASIYMLTPDQHYLYVNRHYEQLARTNNAEIQGKSIYERFEPEIAASLAANDLQALAAKVPTEFEEEAFDQGELRTFSSMKIPLLDDDGEPYAILGISTDITERKRAERSQQFLIDLDSQIRLLDNADDILTTTAAHLGRHLHLAHCTFNELDIEADQCIVRAHWQRNSEAAKWLGTYPLSSLLEKKSIHALASGQSVVISDLMNNPDNAKLIDRYRTMGIQSVARVPFLLKGSLVTVLTMADEGPHNWRQDEIALLETVLLRVWPLVIKAQTEEALRESEMRFRNMADSAPAMLWVTDPGGSCTFLSRGWYEYTGQSEGSGLGEGWIDAIHPDDQALTYQMFLTAHNEHKLFSLDYRLQRPDGSYCWTVDTGRPRFDREGTFLGYIGAVIDINDRKEAEEALRRSEERYRHLFETMDEGFCVVEMIFDEQGNPVDYCFLEANPAFEAFTGLQQAVGKTARELVPNLESHWWEIYGKVATTGEPIRFEQGSQAMGRWFDVSAFRVGDAASRRVAILFTNITERKQFELSLAQNNAILSGILESSRDAIFVRDLEGRYLLVNSAGAEQVGRSKEMMLGKRYHELFPEDAAMIERDDRLIFEQSIAYAFEQVSEQNGVVRYWNTLKMPLRTADGAVLGLISSARDMTEYKRAEEELRRTYEVLALAQRVSHSGVWDWDIANNRTFWSPEYYDLYGFPTETEPGHDPWLAAIHPDDRERIDHRLHELLKGGSDWNEEFRIRHPKRGERWLIGIGRVAYDEAGKASRFTGINLDISERKASEGFLERYLLLSEHARDLILFIRLDGQIVEANAAAVEAYGYDRDTLLRMKIHDLRDPATRSQVDNQMAQVDADASGRGMRFETVHLRQDGTLFPVEISSISADIGDERLLLSVIRDISERKAAEAALAASESKFSTAFSLSPLILTMTSLSDGRLIEVNESFVRTSGYSRTEALGRTPDELGLWINPQERQTGLARLAEGVPVKDVEAILRMKSGEVRTFLLGATVVVINGQPCALTALTDITERKQAELHLRFLAQASALLAGSLDYHTTLENVAHASVPALADWCVIDLLTEEGTLQDAAIVHSEPDKVRWARELRERYPIDPNGTVGAPNVVRTGISEFYPEITDAMLEAVANNEDELQLLRAVGYRSIMLVPLQGHERILGAITFVASESQRHFTPADLQMAEELAHRAAAAIDNAQLYQAVQQRESEVRINEERFRSAFEQAAVGMAHLTPDGHYLRVNDRLCEILGYTREELLQKSFMDITHPDDLQTDLIETQRQLAGEIVHHSMEKRYIRKDGSAIWTNMTASVVRDESDTVKYGIAVIEDIAARKEAEEALRQSEELARQRLIELEAIYDTAPIGLCVLDRDLRWRRINERLATINGYSAAAHLGRSVGELLPDLAPSSEPILRTVLQSGQPLVNVELHGTTPSQPGVERIWLEQLFPLQDQDGTIIGINIVAEEITERKRQERHQQFLSTLGMQLRLLSETDTILNHLVGSLGRYLQVAQCRINEIDLTNQCFTIQKNWAANGESSYGSFPLSELAPPAILDELQSGQTAIVTNTETDPRTAVVAENYHNQKTHSFVGIPIFHQGKWWATLSVRDQRERHWRPDEISLLETVTNQLRDLLEKVRAEEALRRLNATLEQRVAERTAELERSNRELDQFAYIASHDLKAPLRAIDHLTTWLSEDAEHLLPPPSVEHLQKLRRRVDRMEMLLEDLLAYSRAGRIRGNLADVALGDVVDAVFELIAPPEGFALTRSSEMPIITTYKAPLELVLRNLVGNALKHHHRSQGHVHVTAEEWGEFIEVAVADDGPGIPPEFHERIFGMFQTLRPRDEVEGSGIGLAVVKKTVESLGGEVWIESVPGEGSTFRFTWPKKI